MGLTRRQIEYKDGFVKTESQKKLRSCDTTMFCFNGLCGAAGDTRDPNSHFDAVVPPADTSDLSKGIILDDIRLVWFCSSCAERIRQVIQQRKSGDTGF